MGRTPDLPHLQGARALHMSGPRLSVTLCAFSLNRSELSLCKDSSHHEIIMHLQCKESVENGFNFQHIMLQGSAYKHCMQTVFSNFKAFLMCLSTCKVASCKVGTSFVVLANLCQIFNVMHLGSMVNKVTVMPSDKTA